MRFRYVGNEFIINKELRDFFSISDIESKLFLEILGRIVKNRKKFTSEGDIFFFQTIDKFNKNDNDYFYRVQELHISKPGNSEIYVPRTKYYINISDALKNFCLFLITFQISQKIELSLFTNVFVNIIYPSINKIEDFEYCALCTIILVSKDTRNLLERIIHIKGKREFQLDEIWNYMKCFYNKECNNHSDLWTCPYSLNDTCYISKDMVENVINSLILKK